MSAISLLPLVVLAQPFAQDSVAAEPAPAPAETSAVSPEECDPDNPPHNPTVDPCQLNTTAKEQAEDLETDVIDGRERPGFNAELPERVEQENRGAVRAPPPQAFPAESAPIPDRWRLIDAASGFIKRDFEGGLGEDYRPYVNHNLFDPYNQNTLKGDRPIDRAKVPWLPIKEDDWFFVLNAISDTVYEPRTFPIPVGIQTTQDPDRLDVFGNDFSTVLSQTFIVGAALLKGSTAYKPPSVEYRLTLAYNINYVEVPERRVLFVEPSKGTTPARPVFGRAGSLHRLSLHRARQ